MITPAEAVAGLIAAASQFPGAHCCDGPSHPWLTEAAQEHAQYMADQQQQGHQLFMRPGFFEAACKETGCAYASEIAAESWARPYPDALTLGMDAFTSWKWSPGHWSVACRSHEYYGACCALGENGVWYFCLIAGEAQWPADLRDHRETCAHWSTREEAQ